MHPQQSMDNLDAAYPDSVSEVSEVSALRGTATLGADGSEALEGEELSKVKKAGRDLPEGADPDLLLHAIQKREQRSFALKMAGVLCGFALAAYLAGSGNGAILQSVVHLSVGAVAGAGATLLWQRRRASPSDT